MNRIVNSLIKVDLHIHSEYSKKDGDLVSNNTKENIPILMEKLEKEKVNMIAITDHNVFNFDLYDTLVNNMSLCKTLQSILPGIEFDVFENGARFHVIAIFDDTNKDKLKDIEKILQKYKFDNKEKKPNAYKFSTFRSIITDINLNVVLIAHQKSGIRVENQNENLAGVGEEQFDYIVNCEYFDALEFRSGRIEGILKSYQNEKDLKNMRYITGTDCHDWTVYPKQKKTDKSDIRYSYIKSLPTFKGLVMALTESRRVTTAYYDIRKPYLDKISLNIKNQVVDLELSSGLNAIIGDNSIGKSLILEYLYNPKLTKIDKTRKEGYKRYCESKEISVVPIDQKLLKSIHFDRQGNIRKLFQDNNSLNNYPQFQKHFNDLIIDSYDAIFDKYIDRVLNKIKNNYQLKNAKRNLNFDLDIPADVEDNNYQLHAVSNIVCKTKDYSQIIDNIKNVLNQLKKLRDTKDLLEEDIKIINLSIEKYQEMKKKYEKLKIDEKIHNSICSTINKVFESHEKAVNKIVQDQERKRNNFNTDLISFQQRIVDYIDKINTKNEDILFDYKDILIKQEENPLNGYIFITRTVVSKITSEIIEDILMYPFSNNNKLSYLSKVDNDNFIDSCADTKIKKYLDEGKDINIAYKQCVKDYVKSDILKIDYAILKEEDSELSGNSPGKNALIYLDLLSYDLNNKMYIVDQPGDDVSQNEITSDLIDIFRKISDKKQVLFITHKPELVVNLDVDNVIVLKNDEDGIVAYNGALEYQDENINILKDIADTLDGGVDVIRKRWKRYDKRNNSKN